MACSSPNGYQARGDRVAPCCFLPTADALSAPQDGGPLCCQGQCSAGREAVDATLAGHCHSRRLGAPQ